MTRWTSLRCSQLDAAVFGDDFESSLGGLIMRGRSRYHLSATWGISGSKMKVTSPWKMAMALVAP